MFKSKKAVSELISFILITLVVAIVSSVAYVFASGILERNVAKLDEDQMESNLRRFAKEISGIQNFDGASTSLTFSFNSGLVLITDNQIAYQSLVRAQSTESTCFTICYSSNGGYSYLYYNLTNGYQFSKNLTLTPGEYIVTLTNDQNASEIIQIFR